MNSCKNLYISVFSLSTRSLAIFRICFGIFLFLWLGEQIYYFDRSFGPEAIIKPSVVFQYFSWENSLWFHTLSDSYWYMIFLFGCHIVLISFFIVGYKLRYVVFLLRLWTISLQMGNPLFRDGLDFVLASFFPWLLFLPLGEHYSLDTQKVQNDKQVFSIATIGVTIRIFSMYAMIAYHRRDTVFTNSNRLLEIFHMKSFASKLGMLLVQYPFVLKIGSFASLFLEGFSWIFYIFPRKNHFLRKTVVISMIILHTSILLTLQIWMFGLGMMIIWILFYPGSTREFYKQKFSVHILFFQIILFLYIQCLQFQSFLDQSYHIIPPNAYKYARFLGIHTTWNLFYSSYAKDMRYSIEGKKNDNTSRDIVNNRPFTLQYQGYQSENQRGLWQSSGNYPWLREAILSYYCKKDLGYKDLYLHKVVQEYDKQSGYLPVISEVMATKKCY